MADPTTLRVEDGVARISLDDAKVNALSPAMIAGIDAGLDAAEKGGAVAVLRGRPGIFSAGFDFRTFAEGPEAGLAMVRAGAELIVRILSFPRPVVTACTGHAYPAGAFLMLAADQRFGVPGDFRIGLNEVAIGMTVPRFAVELVRHRCIPAALPRVATGTLLGPEEALRLGYLDQLVEADALENAVDAEVARLKTLDAAAFTETKARLNAPVIAALQQAIDAEWREQTGGV